jgi:hypothetical protein
VPPHPQGQHALAFSNAIEHMLVQSPSQRPFEK